MKRRRKRGIAAVAGGWLAIAGLSGCLGAGEPSLSAKEAFARSASALSGSEQYAFTGEVSVVDPSGYVAKQAAYEGKVTGHGDLKLQWNSPRAQAVKMNETSSFQPLRLLEAMKAGNAQIAYDGPQTEPGSVRIRIELKPSVSADRISGGLREELAALGREKVLLERDPAGAKIILSQADATLAKALSTLQARTVCTWKADRRTWFPSELKEETTLRYEWKGKTYDEKRVSATYFLPAARDGTMDERE